MAWGTPLTWTSTMVTATIMNAQIRDNLNVVSSHTHTGAAGFGSSTLSGITLTALAIPTLADQSGSPSTIGRLQRNGNNLEWYDGSVVRGLYADGASSLATLRTLGTGSAQAAAGNHTHS
jgi:hypothetical protein